MSKTKGVFYKFILHFQASGLNFKSGLSSFVNLATDVYRAFSLNLPCYPNIFNYLTRMPLKKY